MLATAFLSAFLSNTSTSIMMLPIGIAIISQVSKSKKYNHSNFGKVLMLGIAYSASIGGFSTLYGTPPNLILKSNIQQFFNYTIDFDQWFLLALPLSITLLFICWIYLVNFSFSLSSRSSISKKQIINKLKELGKIKYEEIIVLIIFSFFVITLLLKRKIQIYIISIDDTIIAIFYAILLFIFNSKDGNKKIISWKDSAKLRWGIVLLFGGGLSLAAAMQGSGLTLWIGEKLYGLNTFSLIMIVLSIVFVVNFLTEITSNLATVSMILPILATLSITLGLHPFIIMISATIAASCAFMLPVATPPNAVVFGSGYLRIKDMIKTGLFMNLISILLVSLYVYYILPEILDIDITVFPESFKLD